MAPENPRQFTPLVSAYVPSPQKVQNPRCKIYKKSLLYSRVAFKDLGFEGGGVGSILFLSYSAKNSETSGGDTTHVFLFLRKNNSLKSSLYESGHLKDRTLATLASHLSFPMGIFPF